MTAEIFRRHDIFFGDVWRPEDGRVGYNEHKWIKKQVREYRPDCYNDILINRDPRLRIPAFPYRWNEQLEAEGYKGGPWGIKVDAFCTPLFEGMNVTLIKLWRNQSDIVKSALKTLKRWTPAQWRRIVDAHHERLAQLPGPDIDTDELVEGDYTTLEQAFEDIGILFDPKIADSVIRR